MGTALEYRCVRTTYETGSWGDLSRADRGAWQAFRDARPSLAGPYFSTGYLDAVGRARGDLEVVKLVRRGAAIGFLPFHRSAFGVGRPAGGPFSDWHGPIMEPGVGTGARDLLAGARLSAFRFHGVPADDPILAPYAANATDSHLITLEGGYDAWKAERGPALQGLRHQISRIGRESRSLHFQLDDRRPETLQTLLAWKSEQFRSTGQFDQFSLAWTRQMLTNIAAMREPGFRGLVSSLLIDGELAAAHLGMLSGHILHYWIPAYDKRWSRLAPGALLLNALARESIGIGVTQVDLGKGDYRYKREFANGAAPLIEGLAATRGMAGRAHAGVAILAHRAAGLPLGRAASLPERALRRLDHRQSLRPSRQGGNPA